MIPKALLKKIKKELTHAHIAVKKSMDLSKLGGHETSDGYDLTISLEDDLDSLQRHLSIVEDELENVLKRP